MLKVLGEDISAYRKQIDERAKVLPIWERKVLTFDEAAEYSGVGITRLRKLTSSKNCPFSISDGNRLLIVREKFDRYMDKVDKI